MGRNDEDKLVAPADFDGPTKNRHCTDILMLLLLFAMWAGMTGIGIYSISNGDYRIVVYPLDYDGNICGTDYSQQDMTDYPYLYYVNVYTAGVCVKECPDLTGKVSDNLTDITTMITYDGIYQVNGGANSELPADFIQVANYSGSTDVLSCTYDTCWNGSPQASWTTEGINEGFGYAYYVGDTYPLLWRCFLTSAAEARISELVSGNSTTTSITDSAYNFWNKLFGDLWTARKYILGFGFGASLILSLIYVFLLRIPLLLTAVIWTSIFISIAMFFLGGYYAWKQASDWENATPQTVTDNTITATKGASITLYVIGSLLALVACCLRRQIQLAIGCVKEAGRAINNMILIFLVPFLQAVGLIIFIGVWCVYAVNLASLGQIDTKQVPLDAGGSKTISYRVFNFDQFVQNCAWYLLFCLFWTSNFLVAVGDLIVCLAVATWYFSRNKNAINGNWIVLNSVKNCLWYHMGTAAYGALILAVIQIIRSLIARAQRAAKNVDSKVARVILCCCQCCFCLLEKCIKFLNKNAYIQTAIFSTAFCKSCRRAFFLILRNAARIAAISYVSAAVLIVGKLFISSVTTLFSYYILVKNLNDELYSVGGPITVIFLISYWVSDMFMDVFDVAISTILQCFIADEEMFGADQVYAHSSLKHWVEKNNEEAEK